MPTKNKTSKPIKSKPPANALYRSRIEICRILRELVRGKHQVFAEIDFDKSLTTRILHVDERSGYLVVGYGDSKRMNSVLFDYSVLQYRANYRGAHLFFKLSNPLECLHEGKHAIKFDLPDALLWSQRREVERVVG